MLARLQSRARNERNYRSNYHLGQAHYHAKKLGFFPAKKGSLIFPNFPFFFWGLLCKSCCQRIYLNSCKTEIKTVNEARVGLVFGRCRKVIIS